jgi:hypothetical protein
VKTFWERAFRFGRWRVNNETTGFPFSFNQGQQVQNNGRAEWWRLFIWPVMAIHEQRCRAASLSKWKVQKQWNTAESPEKLLFGAVSVSETRAVQVDSRLIPIKVERSAPLGPFKPKDSIRLTKSNSLSVAASKAEIKVRQLSLATLPNGHKTQNQAPTGQWTTCQSELNYIRLIWPESNNNNSRGTSWAGRFTPVSCIRLFFTRSSIFRVSADEREGTVGESILPLPEVIRVPAHNRRRPLYLSVV